MKALVLAAGGLALGLALTSPASAAPISAGAAVHPAIAVGAEGFVEQARWGHRIPPWRVVRKLRKRGFWGFGPIKWRKHAYVVFAHRGRGRPVRVKVDAYSGHIIWVKPRRHWRGHGHGGWRGGYGGGHGRGPGWY